MLEMNLNNGVLKVRSIAFKSNPVISISALSTFVEVSVTAEDCDKLVKMLKSGTSSTLNLVCGGSIGLNESSLIVSSDTVLDGHKSASVQLKKNDFNELIEELDGWFKVFSTSPIVGYVSENIIKCCSHSDLDFIMRVLSKEGIRFRSGARLDANSFKDHIITEEHPFYLMRKANSVYTDSARAYDFLSWSESSDGASENRIKSVSTLKEELNL